MSNNKQISFIIPAYNAENTISRAIFSIIDSSRLTNIEIEVIVVLNGCTDDTLHVVESIERKYSLVQHITSGKGVSLARNAGINVASGSWLAFVDADDCLTEDAISMQTSDIYTDKYDFILYGHYSGERARPAVSGKEDESYYRDNDSAVIRMLRNPTRYMTVWAKLFRREIIFKYDIRFNERLSVAEDGDFTLRYAMKCENILFSNRIVYKYSLNSSSVMRTKDGKRAERYITSMSETGKYVESASDAVKAAFNIYILMHLNIVMVRDVFACNRADSFSDRYKMMKELASSGVFLRATAEVPLSECLSLRMLPIFFLKTGLRPLAAFMFSIRARQNFVRERQSMDIQYMTDNFSEFE